MTAHSSVHKCRTVKVKVAVEADELRRWAAWHADAGHAGVAHVLYLAAEGVESVTEQALREAREEQRVEGVHRGVVGDHGSQAELTQPGGVDELVGALRCQHLTDAGGQAGQQRTGAAVMDGDVGVPQHRTLIDETLHAHRCRQVAERRGVVPQRIGGKRACERHAVAIGDLAARGQQRFLERGDPGRAQSRGRRP